MPNQDPCCRSDGPLPDEVRERVLAAYTAHRGLCEDVHQARVLTLIDIWVAAKVQLDEDADVNTVLANLLFALGLLLAPEPRRTSLDTLVAAGLTTAEIFDGPLMLRGFIADDQLTPQPTAVAMHDLLRVMAGTDGVVSVSGLMAEVDGDDHRYSGNDIIPVPPDSLLWLLATALEGRFTISLFRGTVECRPDPDRVARLLDGLWTVRRQTYPLWPDYAEQYPVPVGRRQDLSAYTSVQEQFPNTYGINSYGLSDTATAARHAQARQLKGYLMPFDQLMADYFSQLSFLRTLFSPRAGGASTYAVQSLAPIVPDVAPLLRPDYMAGLRAITAADDPVVRRQSAIVDLLLSLYAERLEAPPQPGCTCDSGAEVENALLRAKQQLLARTVRATRDRGRGADYRRPSLGRNVPGMEVRCRIELGVADATAADGGADGAQAVGDPTHATLGQRLPADMDEVVIRYFLPVDGIIATDTTEGAATVSPLAGQRVAAALLPALAIPGRYRIGILPGEGMVRAVCRGDDGAWWHIGHYQGAAAAIEAVGRLARAAGGGGHRRQLYIVDHTLLRWAQVLTGDDGACYTFRVTAVIATTPEEAADAGWRRQVIALVRENTPSHVAPTCLFLDRRRLRRFLARYDDWLAALRRGPAGRRAEACRRLQHFLETHGAEPYDGDPADQPFPD